MWVIQWISAQTFPHRNPMQHPLYRNMLKASSVHGWLKTERCFKDTEWLESLCCVLENLLFQICISLQERPIDLQRHEIKCHSQCKDLLYNCQMCYWCEWFSLNSLAWTRTTKCFRYMCLFFLFIYLFIFDMLELDNIYTYTHWLMELLCSLHQKNILISSLIL